MKARQSNSVRIIGGKFRRRVLHFPDVLGLRPTPDRVRETLFNWLGQQLHGLTCLDAFAGSGALGFEAVSRGARHVVMLERDGKACEALRRNAQALPTSDVEIVQIDALAYLSSRPPGLAKFLGDGREARAIPPGETFDVIFLDPPFDRDLLVPALQHAATRLRPGGKIYAESPTPLAADGFVVLRQGRAGLSHFCLLELV